MSGTENRLPQWIHRHGAASLLAVAHLPLLCSYYLRLWELPYYQFFPLALAIFTWLAISRAGEPTGRHWILRISLIMLDLGCLAAGIFIGSPWVVAVGACLLVLAECLGTLDRKFDLTLGYLILLPASTLRLPSPMDRDMIAGMQDLAARVSSKLLHHFEYLHLREGNALSLPGKRVLVDAVCGGIPSLYTVLCLAAVIVCVRRRRLMHSFLVLGCAAFFAGMMYVLRIMTIAVAWEDYQADLLTGSGNSVVGYVALTITAILIVSADALLSFVTDPVPITSVGGLSAMFVNPFTKLWNAAFGVFPRPAWKTSASGSPGSLLSWGLIVAASGVVCVTAVGLQAVTMTGETPAPSHDPLSHSELLNEESLPDTIDTFSRESYRTDTQSELQHGAPYSSIWQYTSSDLEALVACDRPFHNWHELTQSYAAAGWEIQYSKRLESDGNWDARLVRMQQEGTGEYATLLFSQFEAGGRWLSPPDLSHPVELFVDRLTLGRQRLSADELPDVYQAQVLARDSVPMTGEQINRLAELHYASRAQFYELITAEPSGD